jgi:hypothetical protein
VFSFLVVLFVDFFEIWPIFTTVKRSLLPWKKWLTI